MTAEGSKAADSPVAIPEVVITRTLHAPREMVFKAWTDPAQVQKWWAPKGFTNPRCEVDARVGVKNGMRIDMKAPDGTVYPMDAEFEEISPPDRLVFVSGALDANGKRSFSVHTTVTFADQGKGKTLLTLRAKVTQIMVPEAAKHIGGMSAGWSQSLEKLVDYADALSGESKRQIVSKRTMNFPREKIFAAWTDPKAINQWWGPKGWSTTVKSIDIRPGGEWHFTMNGPDGQAFKNHIIFREIVPPERIVLEHVTGPQFEVVVTFTDTGCGGTDVAFRQTFNSPEECDKVKPYAAPGNEQNFDKLEAYLGL